LKKVDILYLYIKESRYTLLAYDSLSKELYANFLKYLDIYYFNDCYNNNFNFKNHLLKKERNDKLDNLLNGKKYHKDEFILVDISKNKKTINGIKVVSTNTFLRENIPDTYKILAETTVNEYSGEYNGDYSILFQVDMYISFYKNSIKIGKNRFGDEFEINKDELKKINYICNYVSK